MTNKNQFLGLHPNGSFFIIKDAEKIARSVADEDGFAYFEFKEKNGNVSLRKIMPEVGAAKPPPDLEIRVVKVNGEEIAVTTLTDKAKAAKKAAEETEKEETATKLLNEDKDRRNEDRERRNAKRKARADELNAKEDEAIAEAAADAEKIAESEAQPETG